jgi:hypothetical protein
MAAANGALVITTAYSGTTHPGSELPFAAGYPLLALAASGSCIWFALKPRSVQARSISGAATIAFYFARGAGWAWTLLPGPDAAGRSASSVSNAILWMVASFLASVIWLLLLWPQAEAERALRVMEQS